jgi:hypothetical protein
MISAYLDSLASALSFDRSLSRCVRQEVEDHLREAVAADPAGQGLEAEYRAVANFGDPHLIAAQFAVVSLTKRSMRLGIALILVIAGVFVAMKARVAWYAAIQSVISDDMRPIRGIVGLIDRCSFWLSVFVGIAAWVYISTRRSPTAFDPAYRKRLRLFFLLSLAATGSLIVSVMSDVVLTALQLAAAGVSAEFVVPAVSMAIEIAGAAIIVFQIRDITRRATSASALFNQPEQRALV